MTDDYDDYRPHPKRGGLGVPWWAWLLIAGSAAVPFVACLAGFLTAILQPRPAIPPAPPVPPVRVVPQLVPWPPGGMEDEMEKLPGKIPTAK